MPVSGTVWPIEPHTAGKHELLREYLHLWLRILGSGHRDLVLFDGFAGPGEYVGGEEGSPLIMLHVADNYVHQHLETRVHCIFVENDVDRFENLRQLISDYDWHKEVLIQPILGDFAENGSATLQSIAKYQDENFRSVPSFFMIDPFGLKGVPFSFFRGLLSALDKSECLFTFMWSSIHRFSQEPVFEPYMRELFGDEGWRGLPMDGLKEYVYSRFEKRLRDACAKYVLVFDLWAEGQHIYSLFFATKGIKGCDVMKQVIWKLDPSGSYSFRGAKQGQSRLNMVFDQFSLDDDLKAAFGLEWVSIEQAEEFVQGDQTRFHSGHLRQKTLLPLEKCGAIQVERPAGVHGFPKDKGIWFRFREVSTSALPPKQGSFVLD